MKDINQIKHLLSRAGFGMRFEDLKKYKNASINKAVRELFENSETDESMALVTETVDVMMLAKADADTKKKLFQMEREQEKNLNVGWITKMSTTDAALREKMTLFWSNHFSCRNAKATYIQQLNNIQRANALGSFRTLLIQVSQSPAMLLFLNNQQNHKGHPNENFARELMELFTIGRGNYTEQDVKESARAFTGWGLDKDGTFKMRPFFHDTGIKIFMDKTGNFQGDDIIDILLSKKQTARFISTKLYKYMVNETPDDAHINAMADVFFNANYEIKPLLEFIFHADWFYDDKNTGNLIKSPIDFIVGLNRQFYVTYQKPDVLLLFQRALGQVLFYPPNVAGWPGGRNWIDSSSLMYRLKIASTVLDQGLIDFTGKSDPEDEAFLATVRNQQHVVNTRVQAEADWDKFFSDIPKDMSKVEIAQFLLEPPLNGIIQNTVNEDNDLKTMVVELVSTPEYQLY
ncbi:DUF1800 domain-containing protein [Mucilaginibacter sp. E4BP6]|uniref:DUF1800 domain-containing protein n=1 Tax=Mucilaginibacter sp. E4BP6 TaxID=2723089 RepID=UPI0015CBA7F6|nr:DUF1800 domain-containing protein [Mucilaginibacter sp. E4BP6]NYE64793.1 uncharacterized protein (DUF1800 family) [Mucilaginibacter sp. E4BP6]